MLKPSKIGKVKGLGDIYEIFGPFDEQMHSFQNEGIRLALPEDVAEIRLKGVSNDYSRTGMVPISTKGENTILTKEYPLTNFLIATSFVSSHRNERYLTQPRDFYEQVKEIAKSQDSMEPEDRTTMVLSTKGDFSLTPKMPESKFILGKNAQEYFDKFTEGKITFYDLLSDSKDESLVNYLWFDNPQGGSVLNARGRGLDCDGRSFGVLESVPKARAQKNVYSPKQIKESLNLEGISGDLEKRVVSRLGIKS